MAPMIYRIRRNVDGKPAWLTRLPPSIAWGLHGAAREFPTEREARAALASVPKTDGAVIAEDTADAPSRGLYIRHP